MQACGSIDEHDSLLTLPTSRHGSRAGAQLATCGEAYADGMMRSVQREIWGQLLSRRSSDITSRPETRRLDLCRRTCVSHSHRRHSCRWQHDRSQVVDFDTTSCHFACLIDPTVARNVRSRRAIGACGVEVSRLEVQHHRSIAGWPHGRYRSSADLL